MYNELIALLPLRHAATQVRMSSCGQEGHPALGSRKASRLVIACPLLMEYQDTVKGLSRGYLHPGDSRTMSCILLSS